MEPFFCSLSLFDCGRGVKVSEDFHFDINTDYLRSLLASARRHGSPHMRSGNRLRRMTRRQKHGLTAEAAGSLPGRGGGGAQPMRAARSLPDIAESDNVEADELAAATATAEDLGPASAKQVHIEGFSSQAPWHQSDVFLTHDMVLQFICRFMWIPVCKYLCPLLCWYKLELTVCGRKRCGARLVTNINSMLL